MTILLPIGAVLVLLGVIPETRFLFKWAWRWLSGYSNRTNSTWLKRYTKIKHESGRAHEWHKMPRWKRAAVNTGTTLFIADAAAGFVFDRQATLIGLSVIGLAGTAWVASWIYRKGRRWCPGQS